MQGYLKDALFIPGGYQLYKESDSMAVNLTRILSDKFIKIRPHI